MCKGLQLVMFFSFLMLSACTKDADHSDLHKKMNEIRARKGRPIPDIPQYQVTKRYIYPMSQSNRDPFYSAFQRKRDELAERKASVGAPDFSRPKQALEQFPLDGLKMVGHLKQDGRLWALVQAPDSIIYRVTIGSYMGKHFGRVYSIHENYIGLVETIKEGNKWKKRKIKLELGKDKIDG